jgi:hypothetical protein
MAAQHLHSAGNTIDAVNSMDTEYCTAAFLIQAGEVK